LFERLKSEQLIRCKQNYCAANSDTASLIAAMTEMCGNDYPPETNFPINNWISDNDELIPPKTPEHIVSLTPPASPPILPPSYHVCTQCNKIEPSQMHLYIHCQNCTFGSTSAATPSAHIEEPPALWSYNPLKILKNFSFRREVNDQ